jgi:branched-chain amino acid transport system permease protein
MMMSQKITNRAFVIAVLVLLFALPFLVENSYTMYILNLVGIYVIMAVGLNIVLGYTGQISIVNAGFAGIGAYITALSIVKLSIPLYIALPMAGILTAGIGIIIGFPALRLGSHYLAMATLACNQAIQLIMIHWKSVTMGAAGVSLSSVNIGPIALNSNHRLYFLVIPIALILIYLYVNIIKSKLGRSLIAVRDNEIAAQSMGVSLAKYKTTAFAISGFYAGIGGGLFALVIGYVSPESFGLNESVFHLAILVIGGTATLPGPILGSIFFVVAPELFHWMVEYKVLVFSLIALIFIIFMPGGIYGLVKGGVPGWTFKRILKKA